MRRKDRGARFGDDVSFKLHPVPPTAARAAARTYIYLNRPDFSHIPEN